MSNCSFHFLKLAQNSEVYHLSGLDWFFHKVNIRFGYGKFVTHSKCFCTCLCIIAFESRIYHVINAYLCLGCWSIFTASTFNQLSLAGQGWASKPADWLYCWCSADAVDCSRSAALPVAAVEISQSYSGIGSINSYRRLFVNDLSLGPRSNLWWIFFASEFPLKQGLYT